MGVDALDIGIKLKILKKQGKPSTQRWLLGELRKDGLTFTVRGTRTELRALKQFLTEGGYDFE